MKESTRRQKEQRKHDEALATLLGIPIEEVLAQRAQEERDDETRQVQAIHLFLEHPDEFISKTCSYCKGLFLTNYKFVSNCSTTCRIASLEKIGINWNPMHTSSERWLRSQIPAEYSIPPASLKILLAIAEEQRPSQSHYLAWLHTEIERVSPLAEIEQMNQLDYELSEEYQNTEQQESDPQKSDALELLSSVAGPEEDYLYEP